MSEHQLFAKYRANELASEFHAADKKKNSAKRKQTMKKVIANITIGNHEMVNLFPEVVKIFSIDDIELKKMCYHYFNTYAIAKPDITLSILPTILSDLRAGTSALISLALKNIVTIPIKEVLRESIKPIRLYLEDKDVYLRKTAVYSIAKLYEKNPKLIIDEGLIDSLSYSLGDSNPIVVSAALTALVDINEKNPNIKLEFNKNQASVLVDFLNKTDEWKQITILNSLLKYVPQTHEDALIVIDRTISFLQHNNTAVVLNCFKLLLYLINYVDTIEDYLPRKLSSALTSLLSKPAELQFLVLRNVILLILSKPKLIPFDVSLFFCEYNDPIYIKDTKLEIIYLLANASNMEVVLRELEEYGGEVDVQMSRKAIRAIGNLAVKLDDAAKPCVEALLRLNYNDYALQESTIVFKNIFRRYNHQFDYVLPEILKQADKIEDPDAKASLIWIIGHFAEKIPNCEQILSDLAFTFQEESIEVQLTTLTSITKLFIKKPNPKSEKLVLKYLKIATEDINNPDVRDRGFFYWRILSIQDKFPGTAKEIVDGDIPPISSENEQLDPIVLEELELNIGTLASIYLKPVSLVFRLAQRKLLPKSPARSRIVTSGSSRARSSTVSSSGKSAEVERHIDYYDVPALNVKSVKKQSTLQRRMTLSKSSLTRKLSIRGAFT